MLQVSAIFPPSSESSVSTGGKRTRVTAVRVPSSSKWDLNQQVGTFAKDPLSWKSLQRLEVNTWLDDEVLAVHELPFPLESALVSP